ncbi:hypothetical protein V6N13_074117 [Hibiscus sabdariffa]
MNGGRSRGRGFAGDGRKSGGSMVVPISYPWLLLMCGGNEEGMGELSIKGNVKFKRRMGVGLKINDYGEVLVVEAWDVRLRAKEEAQVTVDEG